eukprot:CAMPEP_0117690570 /NCGR_PEP_ID=MMETSP0804-20121206/25198_1 /TAXON_ID=1074897 /ORGANISM="Tetraselmis astigmatica, Strain CCMP880" /LENGTH=90 /DNA_ID=CAMNT_0005503627 /DNA_START=459 /DNA_END=728 /DNA_ORIENTATION=+
MPPRNGSSWVTPDSQVSRRTPKSTTSSLGDRLRSCEWLLGGNEPLEELLGNIMEEPGPKLCPKMLAGSLLACGGGCSIPKFRRVSATVWR